MTSKKRFPLLPRKKNTDKRDYGHVLVLAGSEAYPGAALLTARAAYASGAGLVTLLTPASIRAAVLKKFPPEVMPVFFKGSPLSTARKIIRERGVDVLALGPGLGRAQATVQWVRALVRTAPVPVVLDADGLNAFRGKMFDLARHGSPLVLTPHAGEFARLFGKMSPKTAAAFFRGVLVLKGPRTTVIQKEKLFRNSTGNPGMAKGGSGDALTGVIAAFIAQGLSPFEASRWGVYFHGKAGDLAAHMKGELSLTPSDLIDFLPKAFSKK